ncbi:MULTISPECIES: cupredoxin domain-containing protein [Cohnella]|uniref:cupredoxin domain-containing protein n=1 Tax=Cohnella TaxID=329857 RepID=UPI0009B9F28D|nr:MULTISPECIES: cupredoxin domain-containing protein [Cohnella]MBN2982974.1 cupredoxin domain-containing protein [Cohnella algarum]
MNKPRQIAAACLTAAVIFTLGACGGNAGNGNAGNGNAGNNNATPTPTATGTATQGAGNAAGGGGTQDITVNATNWAFEPTEIRVRAGDTINLTLNNEAGNHGIEIPELNVNVKGGETATFTVDKAGTYEYHCSIQCGSGHNDMVGSIVVE